MQREFQNVIFTDHALDRLKLRRISQAMCVSAITQPDERQRESDGDTEFIRTIKGRRLHVIAFQDERQWVVKSAWVRGEDDPLPLWRRALDALARLLVPRRQRSRR